MEDQTRPDSERKQRYQGKLIGNSQRNARREYLATLSPELSRYLTGCDFLGPQEYHQAIALFDIRPDGIGKSKFQPEHYRFQEFSWPEQAVGVVQTLDTRHDDAPAFFWIYGGNPIYRVSFGWVRENLPVLFRSPMGVIAGDRSAGVVISEYCGYLKDDPNPDEVVYELAVWGYGS